MSRPIAPSRFLASKKPVAPTSVNIPTVRSLAVNLNQRTMPSLPSVQKELMTIDTKAALYVLFRHGRIRTRRMFDHGEIRHVPIFEYLRFRLARLTNFEKCHPTRG